MIEEKQEGSEASTQNEESHRLLDSDERVARYLAARPGALDVQINVTGNPDEAKIEVQPPVVGARRWLDRVDWREGANCGEWEVTFKTQSPLDPPGPYRSSGPRGGEAVADEGVYSYSVRARDLRTDEWVEVDPDIVIIPGTRY